MASCELNFFNLQFLNTVLYLVEMLTFDGRRITSIFKPTFSYMNFHRIKVVAECSKNLLFLFYFCHFYCFQLFFIKKNYIYKFHCYL